MSYIKMEGNILQLHLALQNQLSLEAIQMLVYTWPEAVQMCKCMAGYHCIMLVHMGIWMI